jgi:hypothetical protein
MIIGKQLAKMLYFFIEGAYCIHLGHLWKTIPAPEIRSTEVSALSELLFRFVLCHVLPSSISYRNVSQESFPVPFYMPPSISESDPREPSLRLGHKCSDTYLKISLKI